MEEVFEEKPVGPTPCRDSSAKRLCVPDTRLVSSEFAQDMIALEQQFRAFGGEVFSVPEEFRDDWRVFAMAREEREHGIFGPTSIIVETITVDGQGRVRNHHLRARSFGLFGEALPKHKASRHWDENLNFVLDDGADAQTRVLALDARAKKAVIVQQDVTNAYRPAGLGYERINPMQEPVFYRYSGHHLPEGKIVPVRTNKRIMKSGADIGLYVPSTLKR